jgi:hypothetical protein
LDHVGDAFSLEAKAGVDHLCAAHQVKPPTRPIALTQEAKKLVDAPLGDGLTPTGACLSDQLSEQAMNGVLPVGLMIHGEHAVFSQQLGSLSQAGTSIVLARQGQAEFHRQVIGLNAFLMGKIEIEAERPLALKRSRDQGAQEQQPAGEIAGRKVPCYRLRDGRILGVSKEQCNEGAAQAAVAGLGKVFEERARGAAGRSGSGQSPLK